MSKVEGFLRPGEVWNCKLVTGTPCEMGWNSLTPTDNQRVRICEECKQEVIRCHSPEEFVQLGNAGKCVAIPKGKSPSKLNSTPRFGTPSVKKTNHTETWWQAVVAANPEFSTDGMEAIWDLLGTRYAPASADEVSERLKSDIAEKANEGKAALFAHLYQQHATLVHQLGGQFGDKVVDRIIQLMRLHFEFDREDYESMLKEHRQS